jgi:DNA-binding SARP family transcriptional activator
VALQFRVLGPLEVLVDGTPARLGGPRQRALLALLLVHANEVVPVARLVDEVWGDDPPVTAGNVLQTYVSQLRKALGRDAIGTRGRGCGARDARHRRSYCASCAASSARVPTPSLR